MKTRALILTVFLLMLACIAYSFAALAHPNQESMVTLYSVLKHRGEGLRSCIGFEAGAGTATAICDVRYGGLYAGDDHDWLESSAAQGNRSVIKDLGEQEWTSRFEVPLVQPFPKLKPGEQRQITVDTSGAAGRDGADAAGSSPKTDGAERPSSRTLPPLGNEPGRGEFGTPPLSTQPGPQARPKRDGKPRIDPLFVKAVAGHMYVIHVVDDSRDFYALFRVESLERGDRCTLSWRLIPAPAAE